MSIKPTKKYPKLLQKPYIFIWLAVLVIVGLIVLYETTGLFKSKPPAPSSGSAYTKGETTNGTSVSNSLQKQNQSPSTSGPSSSSSSEPGDTKSNAGGSLTTDLLTPSGGFVSNHYPNLGGSPAPNTLTSVCTTSPGATCSITFTKDGVTKSLAGQTTDRGGSTYWNNWSLQSIGLTAGTWKIQATATLNGQTKTASDALDFVVAS